MALTFDKQKRGGVRSTLLSSEFQNCLERITKCFNPTNQNRIHKWINWNSWHGVSQLKIPPQDALRFALMFSHDNTATQIPTATPIPTVPNYFEHPMKCISVCGGLINDATPTRDKCWAGICKTIHVKTWKRTTWSNTCTCLSVLTYDLMKKTHLLRSKQKQSGRRLTFAGLRLFLKSSNDDLKWRNLQHIGKSQNWKRIHEKPCRCNVKCWNLEFCPSGPLK